MSNVVTVSPITNTQYTAIITDNICFVTDTLYTNVTVGQLSQYSLSKSNDIDCVIGESKLTATGGLQYEWSPGESLSDSTIANPIATPTQTTTYHIKITNADGCIAQDTLQVKVIIGAVENGYKLPGAFTPNNDMINDCFGVREWGALTNLDFSVYNRWGNLIFHTNNPSECWDGTYKGVLQPPGAYIYQISAHAICGTVYRKGTVVLIR